MYLLFKCVSFFCNRTQNILNMCHINILHPSIIKQHIYISPHTQKPQYICIFKHYHRFINRQVAIVLQWTTPSLYKYIDIYKISPFQYFCGALSDGHRSQSTCTVYVHIELLQSRGMIYFLCLYYIKVNTVYNVMFTHEC